MLLSQGWHRPHRHILPTAADGTCGRHTTNRHPNQVRRHFWSCLKGMHGGPRFDSWLGFCFCHVGQRDQVCRSLEGDGEVGFIVWEIEAWQHPSGSVGLQTGTNQNLRERQKAVFVLVADAAPLAAYQQRRVNINRTSIAHADPRHMDCVRSSCIHDIARSNW